MIPYINRELSWLEFNQRVLNESKRKDLPLLERVKFLSISGSNLDEFFQVRIGGLAEQQEKGLFKTDPSGMSVSEQLFETIKRSREMMDSQYELWNAELLPNLHESGIHFKKPSDLSGRDLQFLRDKASKEILPILTPVALQYEVPSLNIPALQLCIVCKLETQAEAPRYTVVPIPKNLPRFITLNEMLGEIDIILIEEVIAYFLADIFPHERISEMTVFRLTKNSNIVLEDEQTADLANEMEKVLNKRRNGNAVRVEIPDNISIELRDIIARQTGAKLSQFINLNGPLGFSDLFSLSILPGFENLKYEPWQPQNSVSFPPESSIFDTLDDRSVVLFHPYESFDPVVKMLEEAASDSNTLAIKQVLYRTASKSLIIEALKKAAINGIQVTVLIELKARFDEAQNILRAEELRKAGVQVIYGVKGFKTHAKATLIIRKSSEGLRRYVHLGTGNYNETTANLYTDISYLSSHPDLGSDTSLFFNMLTGHSKMTRFKKLRPAPTHMKRYLLQLIESEAEQAKLGHKARILGKMNSLQDPDIINALYKASQVGVDIKLNVRGICCLKPGMKDLSENITVISIIDRYLEHTRTFAFEQSGEQKVFISSADWMVRNLEKRLELLIPIEDPSNKKRIINYLKSCFKDNTNSFRILPDGTSERISASDQESFRFQKDLYLQSVEASENQMRIDAHSYSPHIKK